MISPPHRLGRSLIVALTGTVVAWYALGAPSPAAAQETVIRYLSNRGDVAPYELADALGWLKEKGIRIESEGYSGSGPESLVALGSGSVDLAGAATPAVIN